MMSIHSFGQEGRHYIGLDAGVGMNQNSMTIHLVRQNLGIHISNGLYAQLSYSAIDGQRKISKLTELSVLEDVSGHILQMKSYHLGLRKYIQFGVRKYISAAISGHVRKSSEVQIVNIVLDDRGRIDNAESDTKFATYNSLSFDLNLQYHLHLRDYIAVSLSASYFHNPASFLAGASVQFYFNLRSEE